MTSREKIHERSIIEKSSCLISALAPQSLLNETRSLRVAAYIWTAVDGQASSCELLKKQMQEHPNWTFAGIYHDECERRIPSMSRKAMSEMFEDCQAGRIDMIITRSASCLSKDFFDFILLVRALKELNSPVGIWCEDENIYTMDFDSNLALKVLSGFAEEESRMKAQYGGGGHRW